MNIETVQDMITDLFKYTCSPLCLCTQCCIMLCCVLTEWVFVSAVALGSVLFLLLVGIDLEQACAVPSLHAAAELSSASVTSSFLV